MKTLVFATHNPNKLEEVRSMLPKGIHLKSLEDIGCHEPIPETGQTLEENALIKANYISQTYGLDCFADDTGLEVEALNGAPGVFSARYAGPKADAGANMDKLLGALQGEKHRKGRFRTVIALILDGRPHMFEGIVQGEILSQAEGTEGFGYDPIFRPEGSERSFARYTMEEKNAVSHRGRAFRKLQDFLRNTLQTGR